MATIPVVNQPGKGRLRLALNATRKGRLPLLFVVAITFLLPALCALHGMKARGVDASTTALPAASDAVGQAPAPPPSGDQIMSFAYFIEQDDMASTIRLNNNLPDITEATVTIFNNQGQSFTVPTLSLPPQDVQRFRLADLLANAPGDFRSGNVQVAYHGPPMAVTGQVSIASTTRHVIFESYPTMAMAFASSRLDGIVWVPDAGTQVSAALTNTTGDSLAINIGARANTQSLTLNAHETRVVDLRELLSNQQDALAALVRIEHNGSPGALIVNAFAINKKTGFSSNLLFIDRATAKTAHLAGAHVRFGKPARNEGFPAGTRFSAPLMVANASDQPTKAHVFVDYTIGGVAGRLDLGKLKLAPQQVRQIELASEMARRGVKGPVDDAGVDIEYSGSPGAVIARLTSVDHSGDYAFDVPVKDPLAEPGRVGGSYPWRLQDGFTTVLHLKNTINQPVYALIQVRYPGGTYNLERLPLAPFQTIAVDIQSLRDAQQKDIRGSVMPKEVESGQLVWYEETPGSLIGRAEVRNVAVALASSFSCGQACECGLSFLSAAISPSSFSGMSGSNTSLQSQEMRQDCFTSYGPYDRTNDSTWTTSNSSVATVSNGSVHFVSAGSVTIHAQFSGIIYANFPTHCSVINPNPNPGSSGTVMPFITLNAFGNWNPTSITSTQSSDIIISVNASNDVPASTSVTLSFGASVSSGSTASFSIAPPSGGTPFTFTIGPGGSQSVTARYSLTNFTGTPDVKAVCNMTVNTQGVSANPASQTSTSILQVR